MKRQSYNFTNVNIRIVTLHTREVTEMEGTTSLLNAFEVSKSQHEDYLTGYPYQCFTAVTGTIKRQKLTNFEIKPTKKNLPQ